MHGIVHGPLGYIHCLVRAQICAGPDTSPASRCPNLNVTRNRPNLRDTQASPVLAGQLKGQVWWRGGADVKIRSLLGPHTSPSYQTPPEVILNSRHIVTGPVFTLRRQPSPFGGKKIICVSLLTDIKDKAVSYQP